MMRSLARAVVLVVLLSTSVGVGEIAASATPKAECRTQSNGNQCTITTAASGSGVDLSGTATTTLPKTHAPVSGHPVGVATPQDYVTYDYAPTCTANSRLDADVLCGAAVATCQPADTGLIRYWRWTVTHDGATGAIKDVVLDNATYCLGPDAAGLPPIAVVAATVERDFKSLVVVKGTALVKPRGTTLVNYRTEFSTEAKEYTLAPITILGHSVVVSVHPKQYDWYFGDGESALDAGPGQADSSDVTHTYTKTGAARVHVVITWTGTFTIDGGAVRDVQGTAVTTGPDTVLQVKQARAELVTG